MILGKAEVDSSILSGGTTPSNENRGLEGENASPHPFPHVTDENEPGTSALKAGESREARSGGVLASVITEAFNPRGYSDISTVYAYYTAEEKAAHGKHCEWWTCFSNHYPVGQEGTFIAKVEAENPGRFGSYLISWSGCD